jgi:pyruvate-formate lyase-activating enzyme
MISLIYINQDGELLEEPELLAMGTNGRQVEIADQTWLDLPAGGQLVALPGRLPVGFNPISGEVEVVDEIGGEKVTAVAAILPVGLTRCLLPGYEIQEYIELPLFGYTAAGSQNDRLKVAALQTDDDLKWNPIYYNTPDLPRLVARKKQNFPKNRILDKLGKCALDYHCLTAQNIFYGRWEAGIPVSPRCNARCLGCISRQPAECCPSPQDRIPFVPTRAEVVDLTVTHLESAAEGIVSFGQGCEGEPSLEKELLVDSIKQIRAGTAKGTINMNTNAGDFEAMRRLIDAGLDSVRISLFSARPENYNWYHRPNGYQLEDVKHSAKYAADYGAMAAVNLLFFPGFSNQREETEALYDFIAATGVKQVQIRNLNLDPEKLAEKVRDEEPPGVDEWLADLKARFPGLLIGNYTRPKG